MGRLQTVRHALADIRSALFGSNGESAPILPPASYDSAAPAPPAAPAQPAKPDFRTIGATGTPIVSGFVEDLQEYKSDLRGRAGLATWERMRRSDGDVGAALAACKLPIRSAKFQILPGAKENEPQFKLSQEIADFVEDCLFGGLETADDVGQTHTQRFESVIENALLCLDFGCSGHEDLWRIDGDKIRLRRIAPRLPLTFYRFFTAEDGETLEAIEQWGYRGQQWVRATVPSNKFSLFCLNREGANFYGRSILRQAYQHWWSKQALYRIDSISCERNGGGVPTITEGPNASQEDHDIAVNYVTQLTTHENTGLVLPFESTFELKGLQGRIRDPMPSIQHHSEQITRSVLAMFLNLGATQTGSRALGSVFTDFFYLSLNAVAALICDTISETTIRRLVDFNFERTGKDSIPYPRLHVPQINTINPLEMLPLLKDLSNKDVDLIQPDDETEADLRELLGICAKGKKTRMRLPSSTITERIEESPVGDETVASVAEGQAEVSGPNDDQALGGKGAAPAAKKAPRAKTAPAKNPAQQQPPALPIPARPLKKTKKKPLLAQGKQLSDVHSTRAGTPPSPQSGRLEGQATPKGRPLSRPLRPEEAKHDFDGHADQQDAASAAVAGLLRQAKPGIIRDAAARAAKLPVDQLSNLRLPFDRKLAKRIAVVLSPAHEYGHAAVLEEHKKATGRSEAKLAENASASQDKPNLIAQAVVSNLQNWAASRGWGAAVDAGTQGIANDDLEQWIIDRLDEGSDASLDRYANEGARSAVAGGRWDAFRELEGEISSYVRSEAMDANTCSPCADGDGTEWDSIDDVDWSPGDDCDGGDQCRGQLMPIFADEGTVGSQ